MQVVSLKTVVIAGIVGGAAIAGAVGLWFANRPASHDPGIRPGSVSARNHLFEDHTERAKLHFVHDAGPLPKDGKFFMPQIMGSGGGIILEPDGTLCVLLLTNGGPESSSTNRLYRRMPDGTFQDVSAGSGLDFAGYNMGVAIGDVNNDGLPDVLITQFGGLKLLLNLGGGKFKDVTRDAGLESLLWGTSAAFVDYDRDGYLDLVVVNYVEYDPTRICDRDGRAYDYCPPHIFNKQVAKLFRNLGRTAPMDPESVRFKDVTHESGLGKLAGTGLGVVALDFTGDGWPDIFVANDAHANYLWVNRRDGTFADEAVPRGLAFNRLGQSQANMGIAVGDVRRTGLFDIFVTHERDEYHTLWKQGPPGLFQDATAEAGIPNSDWKATGFGTVLVDFDHDGFLDLAVVNGRVQHHKMVRPKEVNAPMFWKDYADRNQLFLNDGAGRFVDVSAGNGPFCAESTVSRGLIWGDLDGDGAIDLIVTRIGERARLYRNVAAKRGHWLMVRAIEPTLGGRDALGAEISVVSGARKWLSCINPAGSYLCSNDPRAHFGLGDVERVDAIQVRWPDGYRETFPGDGVDRVMVIRKGGGRPTPTGASR
ncbi:MAG: CRTAC1 family protein [Planctomycetes bacterium]|nr:CRTAC1 family protein [Planctomycetota bacterium]